MIAFFFDSNALARRYFDTLGSRVIRALDSYVGHHPAESMVGYSSLAVVEVRSVLRQLGSDKAFKGKMTPVLQDAIMRKVVQPGPQDLVIRYERQLERNAINLISRYGLYTLDALHLATAMELCTSLNPQEHLTFVSSDTRLLEAVDKANLANLSSLDFITCICRACGKSFHPPVSRMSGKKQLRCLHCNSLIRCRKCYYDITKCKNTWMPSFLKPYAV